MATITTVSIVPDNGRIRPHFVVTLEVRASIGNHTFDVRVEDQGSQPANEKQARAELRTLLQEALQTLGDQ
jgi:hypothetical protein